VLAHNRLLLYVLKPWLRSFLHEFNPAIVLKYDIGIFHLVYKRNGLPVNVKRAPTDLCAQEK